MTKLGVYWSVMHRRPQDYEYFKRQQPAVFKIMDGGPNDYAWANANLPGTVIIARDWALSEQHSDMLADPTGTGQRHAREWDGHAKRLGLDRARTLILGINEPRVWEAGVPEALRLYTIALCDEAARLGLRVGAMQLSVGWPNNTGPDTPPDWSPWHGVEEAIHRGHHALVLHEYWADSGPAENWGWWAGRSLKCPWQVPIVIGECGVDMYVKDGSVPHNRRGWQGRMHSTRYAQELADYTGRMSADPRFQGCCVFASDFASHEWYSFDVEPAYQAILVTPVPTPAPVETHLPHIPNAKPTPSPEVEAPPQNAIIDPRVAQAILQVESGGRTHGEDGKPIIRFEAHIFKTYLGNNGLWARHFRTDATRPWVDQMWRRSEGDPWRVLHTGKQADEWDAFRFAANLAPGDAAYKAISVGAAQIMGFNHARIGYPTAQAMFEAFANAPMQTLGFINFCLSDPALLAAIRRKDWRMIAKLYNGSGAVDTYAPLLERAYDDMAGG